MIYKETSYQNHKYQKTQASFSFSQLGTYTYKVANSQQWECTWEGGILLHYSENVNWYNFSKRQYQGTSQYKMCACFGQPTLIAPMDSKEKLHKWIKWAVTRVCRCFYSNEHPSAWDWLHGTVSHPHNKFCIGFHTLEL